MGLGKRLENGTAMTRIYTFSACQLAEYLGSQATRKTGIENFSDNKVVVHLVFLPWSWARCIPVQ